MTVLWSPIELPAPLPDVFEGLLESPFPAYLDSSLVDRQLGRYSYLAADPFATIRCQGGAVTVAWHHSEVAPQIHSRLSQHSVRSLCGKGGTRAADPFVELQAILHSGREERLPFLPPFQGGAIGYFGYDLGRHLEILPRHAVDLLDLPDMWLGLYDWVLAHDHLAGRSWIIVNELGRDRRAAQKALQGLVERFAASPKHSEPTARPRQTQAIYSSNFTRDGYVRAVSAAKERIAAGDIYEVCLSQCFDMELHEDPWAVYRRLRTVSPVPYGAYLGLPDATIASGSPELFLRVEAGTVESRPIKGTRPRGGSYQQDRELVAELTGSEKERAENLMIVDLLRNDLGKVCQTGTVHVPELFHVESYSTVHQMVSTIRGKLARGRDAIDLLRASFPGGSVTGCPKIRAMEIIEELEPTRRGIYCGSIGLLGFNGNMESSIVIRTIVAKGRRAYFQVGGAVVADSEPAAEYMETLDKAKASLLALAGHVALNEEAQASIYSVGHQPAGWPVAGRAGV